LSAPVEAMEGRVLGSRGGGRSVALPAGAFLLVLLLLVPVQLVVDPPGLLLERFLPGAGWLELVLAGLYAAWLTRKMLDPSLAPRWRHRLWTIFTVVFFAQLIIGLLGAERFLMTGELHLPVPALIIAGPLFRGGGLFMPILFGATVLLVGPAWCSHLCYIGAWDHWAARIGRRRPGAPSGNRHRVQWAVLLLVVGAALLLRVLGVSGMAAGVLAAAFGLFSVGVMLAASRKRGQMAHCSGFCPLGLVSTWAGRINPFRVKLGAGCSRCGACTFACRYGALQDEDLAAGSPGRGCTLCGDCLPRCREGHLTYAFPGLSAGASRSLFIVMVVALHASFLAVARM